MTPHDTRAVDRSDAVVIAWESSGGDNDSTQLAALDRLAALARQIDAALLVPIDARTERFFGQIVETLVRHGVAALPVIVIDGPTAETQSRRAAVAPDGMLAGLASACALVEWEGEPCLGIDAAPGFTFDAARAALLAALGASGRSIRAGWLRRRALHMALPSGVDFVIDWPPYGAPAATGASTARPGSATEDVDYALLAADTARRHARESPVALSVLWSSARSIVPSNSATRVTDVSPIKIAHAIDSARRFVHNRAGHGVPFWVLRVAFDPGAPEHVDALPALGAMLARAHRASGATGHSSERLDLPARSTARIAVVVHLYYPELWADFAAAIAALPEPCDVFVSGPLRARDAIERIVRLQFPHAVVFGVSNLGRDVLPFLRWLRIAGVDRYEYVLKLHSKKSVHVVDPTLSPFGSGEGWRRQALGGLVGEVTMPARCYARSTRTRMSASSHPPDSCTTSSHGKPQRPISSARCVRASICPTGSVGDFQPARCSGRARRHSRRLRAHRASSRLRARGGAGRRHSAPCVRARVSAGRRRARLSHRGFRATPGLTPLG